MEEIESIQGSSRIKLYEELGWESLSDRRRSRRILQIYKIEHNITPSNLKEKLPPQGRIQDHYFYDYCCTTEVQVQVIS